MHPPGGGLGFDAAGLKLSDVGALLVSMLLVRIVVLASRIEWVLGRVHDSKGDDGTKGHPASHPGLQVRGCETPNGGLPHVLGVLEAKDALSPRSAARRPFGLPVSPCTEQRSSGMSSGTDLLVGDDDLSTPLPPKRALTEGAVLSFAARDLVLPYEEPQAEPMLSLRRTITVAGSEVAGVISPLKRRSSRGAVLHSVVSSPRVPGSPSACLRMQAELEALDVLPLTTAEEAPLLTRMRIELAPDLERMSVPHHDDVSGDIRLLRFLRGYGHSVSEAAAAYRAMLHTRRQHDVEAIRQKVLAQPLVAEEMPHGREIYPLYPIQLNCGLSLKGHLVSIDPLGAIQLSELMASAGPAKLFEFMIGVSELRQIIMDEMSVETGKLVQSVQVKDLHGLGLAAFKDRAAIATLQQIISTCTSMYPESLATLYIINAPFFFPMAWSIVSTFVSERTKKKIHVLGTDYAETLREQVGPGVVDIIEQLHRVSRAGGDVRSDSPSMRSQAHTERRAQAERASRAAGEGEALLA